MADIYGMHPDDETGYVSPARFAITQTAGVLELLLVLTLYALFALIPIMIVGMVVYLVFVKG